MQTLITQFQSYAGNLDPAAEPGQQPDRAPRPSTINSLGQQIASLNQQIMQAQNNGTGQPPNQLLDQRDTLINQLSQHVGVNTVDGERRCD